MYIGHYEQKDVYNLPAMLFVIAHETRLTNFETYFDVLIARGTQIT